MTAEAWMQRAATAHAAGQIDEALRCAAAASASDPTNPTIHHIVGGIAYTAGKTDRAKAAFRHAVTFDPAFADCHAALAVTAHAEGDARSSIVRLRRALAVRPSEATLLQNLATVALGAGSLDVAAWALREILIENPDDVAAAHNLAASLAGSGQSDEAADAFGRLIARHPEYEPAYPAMAALLAGSLARLDDAATLLAAARSRGFQGAPLPLAETCVAHARALRRTTATVRQAGSVYGTWKLILILGQSNAANFGNLPSLASGNVRVFHRGAMLPAIDPLPGAAGWGGSVWTRLAPQLLDAGWADGLVFAAAARGGTRAIDWPGTEDSAVAELIRTGLRVDHVLWQQGESDTSAGTSTEAYVTALLAVASALRCRGIDAPIHVAVSTYNAGHRSEAVATAQRQLAAMNVAFRSGPDLDDLGSDYRYDDVHFNSRGQALVAERWARVLTAPSA